MKNKFAFFLISFYCFTTIVFAQPPAATWTAEKANEWYKTQPWYCGFNYIPAYAINYTAMWDKTSFDPIAIDKELSLAETLQLNCVRAVLQFAVYEDDPKYFLSTLDTFLGICR